GMAQDGESVCRPSICTAHKKHDAAGSMPGTWHMVGMRMPSHLAASSTVVPGGTLTCRPSMVRVIIAEAPAVVGQAILPAAAFQAAPFVPASRRLKAGGSQDWL